MIGKIRIMIMRSKFKTMLKEDCIYKLTDLSSYLVFKGIEKLEITSETIDTDVIINEKFISSFSNYLVDQFRRIWFSWRNRWYAKIEGWYLLIRRNNRFKLLEWNEANQVIENWLFQVKKQILSNKENILKIYWKRMKKIDFMILIAWYVHAKLSLELMMNIWCSIWEYKKYINNANKKLEKKWGDKLKNQTLYTQYLD